MTEILRKIWALRAAHRANRAARARRIGGTWGPIGSAVAEVLQSIPRRPIHLGSAALLIGSGAVTNAGVVAERLPPEAYGAVWVADMKSTREAFAAQPYMQLLLDEQVGIRSTSNVARRVINRLPTSPADPLFTLADTVVPQAVDGVVNGWVAVGSVIRMNPAEIIKSFDGGVAIYSTLLVSSSGSESIEWDAVFAAEVVPGRRDAAEAYLKGVLPIIPERAQRRKVTYQGVTIDEASYSEDGSSNDGLNLSQSIPIVVQWGWCDDVLLISEGRGEPLKKAIAALKSDNPGSWLSATRGYAETRTLLEAEPNAVHLFFDIERKISSRSQFGTGRDAARRADVFGVRSAHPIQAVLQVRGRTMELRAAITLPKDTPPTGLMRVLSSGNPLADVRPALVPEDALAWGLLNVDLQTAYMESQSIITALAPGVASVIPTALSLVQQNSQVDFSADVIAPIEGDVVCYVRSLGNGPGDLATAIVLPLKPNSPAPAALDRALSSMALGDLRLIDMKRTDVGENLAIWEPTPVDPAKPQATGLFIGSMPRAFLIAGNRSEAIEQLTRLVTFPPKLSTAATTETLPLRALSRTTQAALMNDFQVRRTMAERASGFGNSFPGPEHIRAAMGGLEFDLRAERSAALATWKILPP